MKRLAGAIVLLSIFFFVGASFVNLHRGGFSAWAVTCLIVAALLSIILTFASKFRKDKPHQARLVGKSFFWLGNAIAVFCLGSAVYESYAGISAWGIGLMAGLAVFYWVFGWSIRRILTPNGSEDLGTTHKEYSYLMDEH